MYVRIFIGNIELSPISYNLHMYVIAIENLKLKACAIVQHAIILLQPGRSFLLRAISDSAYRYRISSRYVFPQLMHSWHWRCSASWRDYDSKESPWNPISNSV